ncbi:hypothetical protein [Petrachloros mirabilis]
MALDPIVAALQSPGNLRFLDNLPYKEDLISAGGRVVQQPTGHLVFYRQDGRRFLGTDPAGNPLHECEWGNDQKSRPVLLGARIKLDWGGWVGLRPSGLVNETSLNLASKPGWQGITAEDLRDMAAQALRVPIEEVRWFYKDEDLVIGPTGRATIRHRKDAFYWLEDGSFDHARFMSCMGAMNWAAIDFLPVVELFKSLLPGTGSAVFELIRGLYDDQHDSGIAQQPLRYRGIPTYPSEAAFRLFSNFFTPISRGAVDAFTLFMDQTRAHQVEWLPAPVYPRRYFDAKIGCCLTVRGDQLDKVTVGDDPAGLSYSSPNKRRIVPCDRVAQILNGRVVIRDRNQETIIPMMLPKGCREDATESMPPSPIDWRSLFVKGVPPIDPGEAFGAVLFYPQDESEISELAAQPFVADYLQDLAEQDREIGALVSRGSRFLIENGDAVIASCIPFDRPRDYTVLVRVPAFAQRQAQQLWMQCAELQRWEWLSSIRFLPAGMEAAQNGSVAIGGGFDLIYHWVPYLLADKIAALTSRMQTLRSRLNGQGQAFVVGPTVLAGIWRIAGLRVIWQEAVEHLPTFRMHRTILPKAQLKPGLTLFQVSAH